MDQVVAQIGKKGNCTYCGVFRRQALDRGAAQLGVKHVVTGHNADDVAETVLMNLLRGDLPRLSRATSIVTDNKAGDNTGSEATTENGEVAITNVKRSKPLMYAYEKEIVLYAHHNKLDYFSTECLYSPEAFRGSARTLIKNLERIRPESILDVVRSGIDMAMLVPDADGRCKGACGSSQAQAQPGASSMRPDEEDDGNGGCGSGNGRGTGGEMGDMERKLQENERAEEEGTETEIKLPTKKEQTTVPLRPKKAKGPTPPANAKQTLGKCERCGYMSSQAICKACMLLEGLNKNRPKTAITVDG
ncbi:adenine nucleotide alpha hydrolases-like protein, partial [Aureobasidium melanogenum]